MLAAVVSRALTMGLIRIDAAPSRWLPWLVFLDAEVVYPRMTETRGHRETEKHNARTHADSEVAQLFFCFAKPLLFASHWQCDGLAGHVYPAWYTYTYMCTIFCFSLCHVFVQLTGSMEFDPTDYGPPPVPAPGSPPPHKVRRSGQGARDAKREKRERAAMEKHDMCVYEILRRYEHHRMSRADDEWLERLIE